MGGSCLSLVPGQDLDTMEESSEIKVETDTSKTSWIRSSMVASGKRISKAFSYITGEMKECGEGLKGRGPVRAAPDPLERSHPIVPQETHCQSSLQTRLNSASMVFQR